MVLTGNCIYSAVNYNILAEDCDHMTVSGNSFRRHTARRHAGVRLEKSKNVALQGCVFEDESKEGQASKKSLLDMA